MSALNLHGIGAAVYTIKIRMKTPLFLPDIPQLKISFEDTSQCHVLSYVSMDYNEYDKIVKALGLFLEEHAMRKLKAKYAWAHGKPPEPEMPIEHLEQYTPDEPHDMDRDFPWDLPKDIIF